jgi:hypothetical protein
MKSTYWSTGGVAAISSMVFLTACATGPAAQQGNSAGASTSETSGMMSSGDSSAQTGMMDMKSMCDMHDKMMSAKTYEERQAIMDERMKNMSPQMRQDQLQMMQNRCKK